jgi:alkyldihydroxyacetonephosphate synthase
MRSAWLSVDLPKDQEPQWRSEAEVREFAIPDAARAVDVAPTSFKCLTTGLVSRLPVALTALNPETKTERRRKHWGWGYEDRQPSREELVEAAAGIRERLGFGSEEVEEPVPLEAIELPAPRLDPPPSLGEIVSSDAHDRISHAYGRAYRDVVRAFRAQIDNPPDLVARPRDESEIEAVLAWCADAGAAAIPYGGGTSVVGGVEPRIGDAYAGSVTVDLGRLDRVLEVDADSRAARIQAGAQGPALEDQLRGHGLTLRHFPQSFEFSTLGGWIATRAGGHFATLYTHIDDLVESVRAIAPTGVWESRRLPGSGAGPSPDRMLIGSEGILAVITEAWVRVFERPRWKLSCGVAFDKFASGARAVREISQAGLHPANCRLLDEAESALTHAGPTGKALLVLGFESAHHPIDDPTRVAVEAAVDHGGQPGEIRGQEEESGEDAVGAWRQAFLAAPYLRDTFVACGVLSDTFETAITWDRFPDFHAEVMETARRAVSEASGAPLDGAGSAKLSCRFTHVYPDGPAPYYTVLAPAKRGGEVEQWDEVKAAVSDAVLAAGGTITHHHAVGRDHRHWYDRQRPDPFAEALRGAKRAVDPAGTLNPGVLLDP